MSRILMVTPYPPERDGLANYAVQEVRRLRADGHEVEVLSPRPSAAHHHLDLQGPRGPLALGRRLRDYDEVIVQYHPAVFLSERSTNAQRAATAGALLAALRYGGNVELRVHEFDVELDQRTPSEQLLARAMWRAARRVVVHTETDRALLAEVARLPKERIEVDGPGADSVPRPALSRAHVTGGTVPRFSNAAWPVEGDVDRARIMEAVRARAAARRHGAAREGAPARSGALRRLAPLSVPDPVSARPGASFGKRLVRRLTAWEVDPLVRQVNRLQHAVVEALEGHDAASSAGDGGTRGRRAEH